MTFFSSLDLWINKKPERVYYLAFLLLFLVYLHHLGVIPFLADEPTRTAVAMEMILSKNYWVPTINGEFYYRKPPLFNWIIIGIMKLAGSDGEINTRLASVIPLFLFGLTILRWGKRYTNIHISFLAAIMFITCGRMLVYASFIGHIDVLYSWVTFLGFILAIETYKKQNWWVFFVGCYALHGIAFLFKGLPSVIFPAATAFALLVFNKNWKKLLDYRHFIGIGVFVLIVGAYFWKYSQYNTLDGWYEQLWDQSKQRTVADKKWYESILHLFTFPFDQIMHLLPWSLFVPIFFLKRVRQIIWNNYFLKSISVIFLINLIPYWLSPGVYPRYMFMLYPLFLLVLAYFYWNRREEMKVIKWLEYIIGGAMVLFCVAPFSLAFVNFEVGYMWPKALLLVILFTVAAIAYWKSKQYKFLWLLLTLITFRLGFNWFIWEQRLQTSKLIPNKERVLEIAEISKGKPLYLLWGASMTPEATFNHDATYYIESVRDEILRYTYTYQPGDQLIVHHKDLDVLFAPGTYQLVGTFHIEHQDLLMAMVEIK